MKTINLCPALAGALLMLGAAHAATAEDKGRVTPPAVFDNDIRFEVAGFIPDRCTVHQKSTQASFGDVLDTRVGGNRAAELDLAFSFACNGPFRVAMTSQNGGLLTQTQGSAPFRNRLDYSAALAIEGGRQTDACDSADMVVGAPREDRCVFRFRNRAGAAGPATVKLTMAADPTPLLAGQYADRLVVRITPLLGGDGD